MPDVPNERRTSAERQAWAAGIRKAMQPSRTPSPGRGSLDSILELYRRSASSELLPRDRDWYQAPTQSAVAEEVRPPVETRDEASRDPRPLAGSTSAAAPSRSFAARMRGAVHAIAANVGSAGARDRSVPRTPDKPRQSSARR
jgi:hypothetical protein